MVGNSLRSDIEPVVRLGGWGVYMPYHVTWAHEAETDFTDDAQRMLRIVGPDCIADAVATLAARAAAS
jgi:putative hydrolase of the HAD superfamily